MPKQNNKKKIYLYADRGADFLNLETALKESLPTFEICRVTRSDLVPPAKFSPENVAAFFLPGAGSHGEYDVRLGMDGMKAIQSYVSEGGLFYGFCAGAYYASTRLEWKSELPEKKRVKTPHIALFNGVAQGPIKAILENKDKPWHWDQAVATNVFVNFSRGRPRTIKALYWGGPLLTSHGKKLEHDPNVKIIARFSNLPNRPACLIEKKHEKGVVILSSIHPEISKKRLKPFTVGTHNRVEEMQSLMHELSPYEPFREQLWSDLMSYIHKRNPVPKPIQNVGKKLKARA